MPIDITMPALSPTMEEGNLAKWLVKEGDVVKSGDILAEIETDKATMEVEAVDEGTIARIVVPAGTEGVKVNALIAVLAAEGEDASAALTPETGTAAAADPAPVSSRASDDKGGGYGDPAPRADSKIAGAQSEKAPPAHALDGSRTFASPLARRLAKDAGIDLTQLDGSGPHGRVVKADVEAAAKTATVKSSPAPAAEGRMAGPGATARPIPDETVLKLFQEGSYKLLPHDGMRRTIASRLTESHQTIPAYFLSMECTLDALLKLREDINRAAPMRKTDRGDAPVYKLSVNDFMIKAMALALREVPAANASWTSTARLLHSHADVGVAVAIPDGLITPIVRRAEEKTLSAISNEIKDLAKRAREKKLKPHEFQGGTTAVSNLGMFGVASFTSIINPPHASIVSIGAGVERAVVTKGAVGVATLMTATFAFDHRVIDGALGAELAAAFKRHIENPVGMLV